MIRQLRSFVRASDGVAAVEFAITLPVLLIMFYGCIEVGRYILIVQKTEKLAHTVADVVAQSREVTVANLNQLFEATADITRPFATGANSRIMVSSLYRAPGDAAARVRWCHAGGGTMLSTNALGGEGAVPVMPGTFTFNERENVIAAQVFYQFSPLLTDRFFGTTTIYRTAFYKPRLGYLTDPPAGRSGC